MTSEEYIILSRYKDLSDKFMAGCHVLVPHQAWVEAAPIVKRYIPSQTMNAACAYCNNVLLRNIHNLLESYGTEN